MNFFNQSQFGFKKHSSCFSAALHPIHKIKTSVVKKKFSAALFIDLRKAFDTIDHQRLCKKMKQACLSEGATTLMKSYLTNRMRSTRMGGCKSDFINVKVGIAQGSILRPLHFSIYMNDIFY